MCGSLFPGHPRPVTAPGLLPSPTGNLTPTAFYCYIRNIVTASKETATKARYKLALAELEACASTLLSILLAFLDAGVARDQALGLESLAQVRIEEHQGA